ncbi:hypothetical protein GA0116948_101298 [Chitinophaga costaii]|uniref:Uncharacterized protein n=1 Tax=Chitinophaga costaii TaxID=1335309 RepID=A0A1C3Z9K1_9BACT|nr:hypothetical protein GA0116948_101298 [Chitinophaga costaii]
MDIRAMHQIECLGQYPLHTTSVQLLMGILRYRYRHDWVLISHIAELLYK